MVRRELIEIIWMDGQTARYYCESTGLNQGVLNLYTVWDHATDQRVPDKHIPISNIRYWDKDGHATA